MEDISSMYIYPHKYMYVYIHVLECISLNKKILYVKANSSDNGFARNIRDHNQQLCISRTKVSVKQPAESRCSWSQEISVLLFIIKSNVCK